MELNDKFEEFIINILTDLNNLSSETHLKFKEKWEGELKKFLLQETIKMHYDDKKIENDKTFEIDTNILMGHIKKFLSSKNISRGYFSKKILSIHRQYFLEIINYPMPWIKLSKLGRKPYFLIYEFLNDKKKIEKFLIDHENEVIKPNTSNSSIINIDEDSINTEMC